MKLDDPRMLPAKILRMENMQDLLHAEEIEMEKVRNFIYLQEMQLTISTATSGLDRYEKIANLPTDTSDSLENRRSRIIAKFLGQGTVTKELLRHVAASFTNGQVDIIEHPSDYSFDVRFISTLGTPPNMADLTAALNEIKPAHLQYQYRYRYLLIREIHNVMPLSELQTLSMDKFAF